MSVAAPEHRYLTRLLQFVDPTLESAYRREVFAAERVFLAMTCAGVSLFVPLGFVLDFEVFRGPHAWALPHVVAIRGATVLAMIGIGLWVLRLRDSAHTAICSTAIVLIATATIVALMAYYEAVAGRVTGQIATVTLFVLAVTAPTTVSLTRAAVHGVLVVACFTVGKILLNGSWNDDCLDMLLLCSLSCAFGLTFSYLRLGGHRRQFFAQWRLQQEVLQRQAAETELRALRAAEQRAAEEQWRSLVYNAPDLIIIVDSSGRVVFSNRQIGVGDTRALDETGFCLEDLIRPESRAAVGEAISRVFRTGETTACDVLVGDPGRSLSCRLGPIGSEGKVERAIVIATDMTDQRSLEAKLAHAQKLQALGTMAGGIAHDFNNLLTVIMASAELLQLNFQGNKEMQQLVAPIRAAGESAAALTGQLLAFSRRQVLRPKIVDVRKTVAGLGTMIERLIGEHVTLMVDNTDTEALVKVDPGQLEQVLMNLIVNARDAIGISGTVRVSVDFSEHPLGGAIPQACVRVRVVDDGQGMDAATQRRIFEPFFTTKDPGKGTGLGLATVHGIVTQSGGALEVHSVVDRGTQVDVYLPVTTEAASEQSVGRVSDEAQDSGVILLAEDERLVRELIAKALRMRGYDIVAASGVQDALDKFAKADRIDVLLTDVTMQDGDGTQIAAKIQCLSPQTAIVFMSGYADGKVAQFDQAATLLQKPLVLKELYRVIREAINSRPVPSCDRGPQVPLGGRS